MGTRGTAPFKAVLTHGFTLDEQGRKMSKSAGNGVEPQAVMNQYGADILRLWVMNTDITEDQRIGPEVLKQTAELYRRLRNTLRWLLGSLSGFTPAEAVPLAEMPELERWVLHRLSELDALVRRAVATHDWAGVYPAIHAFCSADLSAFYFDVRKDSLYCDRFDHPTRRAARTVLDHLHRCLSTWLAPVLAFTAEEAWTARFGEASSVHLTEFFEVPEAWRDEALARRWEAIRMARRDCTERLEQLRAEGIIRSSLEAKLVVSNPWLTPEAWSELCIVSSGQAGPAGEGNSTVIDVFKAVGQKCARCWKVLEEVGSVRAHPTLCLRCADAVDSGLVPKAA